MGMNYFDLIFAVFFLWAAYKGFSKGFIIHAASLAALILGIYGAVKFSDFTAGVLTEKLHFTSQYLSLIAFAVTFVIIVIGVHFFARLLDKLVKAVALGFVNRIAGVLFALLKTAFLISIVLVIINGANRHTHFLPEDQMNNSLLYEPLSSFAPMIFPYLRFGDFELPKKEEIAPGIVV
ncbi:MAG: CvpA family protein [Bacteroidales bacterium]|nr:CvpA family protein [Bacteroidales bacterium]